MGNTKNRTGINWFQLRKLRIKILAQQRFKCLGCTRDIITNNLASDLHHIDSNPKNNRRSNLEVLCVKCHQEVHPDVPFITNGRGHVCAICSERKRTHGDLCQNCYHEHFTPYRSKHPYER